MTIHNPLTWKRLPRWWSALVPGASRCYSPGLISSQLSESNHVQLERCFNQSEVTRILHCGVFEQKCWGRILCGVPSPPSTRLISDVNRCSSWVQCCTPVIPSLGSASGIQDWPQWCKKLEASLSYVKSCLTKKPNRSSLKLWKHAAKFSG